MEEAKETVEGKLGGSGELQRSAESRKTRQPIRVLRPFKKDGSARKRNTRTFDFRFSPAAPDSRLTDAWIA